MEANARAEHLLSRLQTYQELSNRHDIDGIVAMYTADGTIEYAGQVFQGPAQLRPVHEFDQGSASRMTLSDLTVEGDVVRGTYITEDEFHRVCGAPGARYPIEFVFRGDQIAVLRLLPPDEEESARLGELRTALYVWVSEHYLEGIDPEFQLDYASGVLLRKLALAWQASGTAPTPPPAPGRAS